MSKLFLTLVIVFNTTLFCLAQGDGIYSNYVTKIEVDSSYLLKNLRRFKNIPKDYKTIDYLPKSLTDGNWVAYFKEDTSRIAIEIQVKNGTLNGLFITYYFNGNFRTLSIKKNGEFNGKCYSFFENGLLQNLLTYQNGIKNGIEIQYDESGKIIRQREWVNDHSKKSP